MSLQDTYMPHGGRNVHPNHGIVTGMFGRYFVPGTGCVISSISLNGTAVTPADFGLDEAPAEGIPFYIGNEGDSITSIAVTGGPLTLPFASKGARP